MEVLKDAQVRLDKLLASAPKPGSSSAASWRAKLEAEAKALFNTEELAVRALGKHWETGTPEEQTEFVTLFSDLVRDTYLDQLEGQNTKGFSISWDKETISGKEATVDSTLKGTTPEGKPITITVTYKLIQKGSDWTVYDVVTDGSSLLSQYKSNFNKMFKKEGSFEGVLKKLRAQAKKS